MKVRELIAVLSACDPDAEVVIDDADTNWLLNVKIVFDNKVDNRVEIGSDYGEVVEKR